MLLFVPGCTTPDIRACVARCERAVADADLCLTLCTTSCAELRERYGMSEATCREVQQGRDAPARAPKPAPPPPPTPAAPPADLHARCGVFIDFTWSCGIGRPAPDPAVDLAVRANNELVVRQALVERCASRSPPHDERLLACLDAAAGDCTRYRECADRYDARDT